MAVRGQAAEPAEEGRLNTMCGIAAQYGRVDAEMGRRMLRRLSHRGPDAEGEIHLDGIWLGHRRLSIVDVRGGSQPLSTLDSRMYLVGNGEIYNHADLRAELPFYPFQTASDNEAALAVIAEHGPSALPRVKGMYAVAAAGVDGMFLACRDPLGIKPLYWAQCDRTTIFASEIKAFDREILPFVREFPPGCYWTPEDGLRRFAHAVPDESRDESRTDRVSEGDTPELERERVRATLVSCVERQMMGDVPVGVLLSGGLDSSIIAAIAARWCERHGTRLKTFAVGIAGSEDLVAARHLAESLRTEHHEASYTAEEAAAEVPEVIRAVEQYDPALIHSSTANYLLARYVSRYVKVVLTGEGADELFAGYDYMHYDGVTPGLLQREMVRSLLDLHHLNLQRCDRTMMAHGLEGRVPFLELDMVAAALSIPASRKMRTDQYMEKHVLRSAFDGWLPPRILWRRKSQFGDGSGMSAVLRSRVEARVDGREYTRARNEFAPPPRTKEEFVYRNWWDSAYGNATGLALGRSAVA